MVQGLGVPLPLRLTEPGEAQLIGCWHCSPKQEIPVRPRGIHTGLVGPHQLKLQLLLSQLSLARERWGSSLKPESLSPQEHLDSFPRSLDGAPCLIGSGEEPHAYPGPGVEVGGGRMWEKSC